MNIRNEHITDLEKIETLTLAAFKNHPSHAPGAEPNEHLIVNRLRANKVLALSLVAEDETGIIGHIAFSPVCIAGESSNWFGLAPVSVAPERQGQGIGGRLIEAGLSRLLAQGADGVVLLGEPAYYQRFGFESHVNLTLPGVPAEYFMIQPLKACSPIPVGEVSFHQSFYG
ncbi:GNAT family N-acetyltransferase [Photobacterium sp. 53610]|uniref:GNAT family N-acetyltransferase n=1 Tax=Photobacterium sp. 53610 TaxID=3102789 RepID=UPI002ED99030